MTGYLGAKLLLGYPVPITLALGSVALLTIIILIIEKIKQP